MSVKDRISEYIEYKSINANRFEVSIGASKSYWKNTKNISAEVLSNIVRVYSDINADWLLTGTGEMLKTTEECTSDINNNDMEEAYKAAIRSMAKELKELERENAELRARLGVKEKETA